MARLRHGDPTDRCDQTAPTASGWRAVSAVPPDFDVAVAVIAHRTCVYLTPGIRRRAHSAVVVIRAYQLGLSHVGAPTGRRCSTAIVCGSVSLRIPCSPWRRPRPDAFMPPIGASTEAQAAA